MGQINYLNASKIETIPGAAATITSLGLQLPTLAWALVGLGSALGRRRRDTRDPAHDPASDPTYDPNFDNHLVRDVVFKVMDDLDDPACLSLALCHASSLPEERLTQDHRAIISLLSPAPGIPFSWPDVKKPSSKYQYASFIGKWAGLIGAEDQCNRVFPTCAVSGADVIESVANWKLPCSPRGTDNNV